MGKNKVMQLANVDGFSWALSAHEVIPHPYPHPRPEEDRTGIPILPVVLCSCMLGVGFPELSLQVRLPPGLKKAGL